MSSNDIHNIIKKYIQLKKRMYCYNTIAHKKCVLNRFFKSGHLPSDINRIQSRHIVNFLLKQNRRYSPYTINNFRNILHAFFNYCHKSGEVKRNPANSIPSPKLPKKIPKYLDEIQIDRLFRILRRRPGIFNKKQWMELRVIIGLCLFHGLTQRDMASLRPSDINLRERKFKVLRSFKHNERILPLFYPLDKWLREFMSSSENSSYLFKPRKSQGINFHEIYLIDKLARHMNMKINVSILQNTFFYYLFNTGIDERIIQAILGRRTYIYIYNKKPLYTNIKMRT